MFINYPSSYNSLQSEVSYSYKTSSVGDITIYITDVNTEELYGVKKFYSTDTATVNVSPIVRPHLYPEPTMRITGFVTDTNHGTATIKLTDDNGNVTMSRTYTISNQMESELGLVSTFGASDRALSLGEFDLLRCRVTAGVATVATVRQYVYGESIPQMEVNYSLPTNSTDGFVNFNVAAIAFSAVDEEQLEAIEVVISQGDTTLATVGYSIITPPVDSTRVAWISSRGSIEFYTFPVVRGRSYRRNSGESRRTVLTLGSAYESFEVREALAEIIDSQAVWVVSDDEFIEVESVSSTVSLSTIEELATVELELTYREA